LSFFGHLCIRISVRVVEDAMGQLSDGSGQYQTKGGHLGDVGKVDGQLHTRVTQPHGVDVYHRIALTPQTTEEKKESEKPPVCT